MRTGPGTRRTEAPVSYATSATASPPARDWFAQWSGTAANLRRIQRGALCEPDGADARFSELMATAQVVSFDVFDTLVTRACAAPSDVFLFLALEPPFRSLGLPAPEIAAHRRAAEISARRERTTTSGTDAEVTLTEIHHALAERLGLTDVAALAAAELAAEKRLVRANPRVVAWLQAARTAGKRVLAISDTWYTAQQIHDMLAAVGIDLQATRIFTSSDARATKQDGRLFRVVSQSVAAPVAEWLHVGDHPVSDRQTPSQLGLRTLLQPFDGARGGPSPCATLAGSVRSGLTTAARHHPGDAAWRIGYRTLGPLLTGFAQWLGAQARESGAKRIVFMLRDGLLFERICRVSNALPSGIGISTLPASRRAALLPAMLSDAKWALPGLLAGVGQRPIGEYFSRLGLTPHKHATALHRVGVTDLSLPVDARVAASRNTIIRAFSIPEILAELSASATTERNALLHALGAVGLRDRSVSMLVDLGWNGTIQKALHRVVATVDGRDPQWLGCYLATWPGITDGAPSAMRAAGFVCDAGTSEHAMRTLATGRELLEVLCSSFDGSLLHFAGADGAPVLAKYEFDDAHATTVRMIHDGAAAYASAHTCVLDGVDAVLTVEEALHEWSRLTHTPTDSEARLLGHLSHSDNVGSQTSRRISSFTASDDDGDGLLQDWALAYWKQGLTAQRTRAGAALRSILWLADDPPG
jgi:FMN phosphatase YigB (HAD superfamily)